jgi:hypothetical protein
VAERLAASQEGLSSMELVTEENAEMILKIQTATACFLCAPPSLNSSKLNPFSQDPHNYTSSNINSKFRNAHRALKG